jgi:hypothetical protein
MAVLLVASGAVSIGVFIAYLITYYFKPDIDVLHRRKARTEDWIVAGTIDGKGFKAWGKGRNWTYSYPGIGPCPLRVALELSEAMKKMDQAPPK